MIKAQCTGFLNTPPLWEKQQFEIQQFEFPNLELHTFHPKPIPSKLRLGHQIEYVFKQLVEHSDTYEILLYNLQIQQAARTLGEIDFILKDKLRDKLIHVELTYKFYLIHPEISEPKHQIIGPNKRDRFYAKMEKIKQKQFPLLHSPEGAKALSDNKINHLEIEHQCCFKGQLFLPYQNQTVDLGALNTACLAGYWLRPKAFNQPEFANAQFYLPSKSEWVIAPHDQVAWKSHPEIVDEIKARLLKENAPMLWLKNAEAEFEKLFVVWW